MGESILLCSIELSANPAVSQHKPACKDDAFHILYLQMNFLG